jgi:hypothetical protein
VRISADGRRVITLPWINHVSDPALYDLERDGLDRLARCGPLRFDAATGTLLAQAPTRCDRQAP